MTVQLTITTCRDCPHAKEGPSYSLDGWDRGNDWTCTKANRKLAGFVERRSERIEIPDWCPLRAGQPSEGSPSKPDVADDGAPRRHGSLCGCGQCSGYDLPPCCRCGARDHGLPECPNRGEESPS